MLLNVDGKKFKIKPTEKEARKAKREPAKTTLHGRQSFLTT